MCVIQNFAFIINGSIPSATSCSTTSGNRIELEADVTFSQSEVGLDVKVGINVIYPDNTQHLFYAPIYRVTASSTQSFIIDITNIVNSEGTGKYGLQGAEVRNYNTAQQICMSIIPSYGCYSLTVSSAQTSVTINVYIQNNVGGAVEVYRNSAYVATVTTSQAISFNTGDTFKFTAKPSSNYSFQKFCTDSSCTQSTTSNPFTGTVQTSGNIYAFFTSSGGGGTCNISAGYFRINGGLLYEPNCTVKSSDQVKVECFATFPPSEVGKSYKAELKIKLPNGQDFSFYTDYRTVSSQENFLSQAFITPIPVGTYSTVWFVIYDINGNTICSSDGKTGTVCKSITVTEAQQYHNECINNTCTQVSGAGTNQCTNVGGSCGVTQYHNECINNVCTQVSGAGTNQCTNVGGSCGVTQYHNECINNTCTQVSGAGTNQCPTPGSSCLTPPANECPNCDLTKNICILGNCIPKNYAIYAGVGFLALLILRR